MQTLIEVPAKHPELKGPAWSDPHQCRHRVLASTIPACRAAQPTRDQAMYGLDYMSKSPDRCVHRKCEGRNSERYGEKAPGEKKKGLRTLDPETHELVHVLLIVGAVEPAFDERPTVVRATWRTNVRDAPMPVGGVGMRAGLSRSRHDGDKARGGRGG